MSHASNGAAARGPWDFATPLFHYTDEDPFTIADSLTGVQIVGGTGSGKTSGSGRTILVSLLKHGYGGLALTAKADDRAFLLDCVAEAGRRDSALVFAPDQPWTFNFLDHQWKVGAGGSGNVLDIENMFSTVIRTLGQGQQGQGGDGDYWHRSSLQLIRNCLHLLAIVKGEISPEAIFRALESAPQSAEAVRDERWQDDSFLYGLIREGEGLEPDLTPGRRKDYQMSADYFCKVYAGWAPETRSIVDQNVSSFLDPLLRSPLRELFCQGTNLIPEATFDGAFIICDLSKHVLGEAGRIGSILFKYAFQRACERRRFRPGDRPVCLYIDECQLYVSPEDQIFQTTARGTGVSVIQLTQNIDNLIVAMGSAWNARYQVNSLLGNLATLIVHANRSIETNKFASDAIGSTLQRLVGTSAGGYDRSPGTLHTGMTTGEQLLPQVLPHVFQTLRTGGESNDLEVEAYVLQQGRVWSGGKNYLPVTFRQAPRPGPE
jgi:hypothetical protein